MHVTPEAQHYLRLREYFLRLHPARGLREVEGIIDFRHAVDVVQCIVVIADDECLSDLNALDAWPVQAG